MTAMPLLHMDARGTREWPGDAEHLRRLDWRFLLPDPGMGRVSYVGSGQGLLRPALAQFARMNGVTIDSHPPAIADLVVAQDRYDDAVRGAVQQLAPGGTLYWELPRWRHDIRREAARLAAWGLTDVRAQWHHPTFDACELIIPLSGPEPLAAVIGRRLPFLTGRVRMAIARRILRLPRLWSVCPSISLIGRRGARSTGSGAL